MSRRNRCFNWDMRLYGTAEGWWDPSDSDTVTIATGVSQLDDKSGNGNTATNADTSRQPPSTTIDSKGALQIDTGSYLTMSTAIDVSGGYYAFAVTDITTTITAASTGTASVFFYDNGSAAVLDFCFGFGSYTGSLSNERVSLLHVEGGGVVSGYGQTSENIPSGKNMFSFYWTGGSNVQLKRNNVTKSLSTSIGGGFTATNRDPSFFNSIGRNTTSVPGFGKLGEMIIYSALNSNYDTSFINNLINHKWGVY